MTDLAARCPAPIPCTTDRPLKDGLTYCVPERCATGEGKAYWDELSCRCVTVCPDADPCKPTLSCGDCRTVGNCVYSTAKTLDGFVGRCRATTNTATDLVVAQIACPATVEKVDVPNAPILSKLVPALTEDCLAAFFDSVKVSCRAAVSGVAGDDKVATYVIDFSCVTTFTLDTNTKDAIAKCLEVQVPKQTDHKFDVLAKVAKRQISGETVQVTSTEPPSSGAGLISGALIGIVMSLLALLF
jgi:hypothetical protein